MLKQSIIEMRAHETAHDTIESRMHGALLSRLCKTQEKMKKLVPSKLKDQFYQLIIDHESTSARMGEIEAKEAYKQGFYDGLEIAVLLINKK
jgi:hypothetical protein